MQENISKRYALGDIASSIKAARLAKGWSQRELSSRASVVQPQISRFENGAVDLHLSTLVELARTLDLELKLIPRTALPAVTAVVKETSERARDRDLSEVLRQLQKLTRDLQDLHPKSSKLQVLAETLHEVDTIRSGLNATQAARALAPSIELLEALLKQPSPTPAHIARNIAVAKERARDVRNIAVHGQALRQTPAYTLDDEED